MKLASVIYYHYFLLKHDVGPRHGGGSLAVGCTGQLINYYKKGYIVYVLIAQSIVSR